jgi:hypothetical protein
MKPVNTTTPSGPTHTDSVTTTRAFIYPCSIPIIFSNSYDTDLCGLLVCSILSPEVAVSKPGDGMDVYISRSEAILLVRNKGGTSTCSSIYCNIL